MKLTLVQKHPETSDAISFLFELEQPIAWQAGQYMHYTLPHADPDERKDDRYFTISAAPFEKHIAITTRFSENGSSFKKALRNLEVGSVIEAEGPEGEFTIDDPSQEFVFIAGGIGITPFRSMLLDMGQKNMPIYGRLLYMNRNDEVVFKKELDDICSNHNDFHISYLVDPKRVDEQIMLDKVKEVSNKIFYVSGPEPMVVIYEKMLLGMGVSAENIKKDDFPGYEWE